MKKLIPILSFVAVTAVACNSKIQTPEESVKSASNTDTTGLAQFQAYKTQMAIQELNATKQVSQPVAVQPAPKTIVVYKTVPVRTTSSSSRRASSYSSGSMVSESNNAAKSYRKKGWSKAAKGTAIGAGSGAILGAVINKKNRVLGGVIGGVLGGAVGYGIGHSQDKKDGRY